MALTRVSPALFQVSNNITSVTVGGSANTISLTFDSNGVITGASNNALLVSNTAITGNIISSQIAPSVTLTTPIISGNLNLDSAGTTGVRVPSANTLAFYEGGVEAMRITSTGDVGIGTSSPAAKLQVSKVGVEVARFTNTQSNGADYEFKLGGGGFEDRKFMFTDKFSGADTVRTFVDSSGNFAFNSGYGSAAVAYGCRAWVNFNGTGTVAIRASGNVTSITDNGTGDYTVNFTNAMPDADYSVSGSSDTGETSRVFGRHSSSPTTSAVRVVCVYPGNALFDNGQMHVAIFR